MPVDILARKNAPKRIEVKLSDVEGDSFFVILKPRAYSFTEQLQWKDRIEGCQADALDGTPSREKINMLLEWAGGVIDSFENLTVGGRLATASDIADADPELFEQIFSAVSGGVVVTKKSGTALNSGSTPEASEALVPTSIQ